MIRFTMPLKRHNKHGHLFGVLSKTQSSRHKHTRLIARMTVNGWCQQVLLWQLTIFISVAGWMKAGGLEKESEADVCTQSFPGDSPR